MVLRATTGFKAVAETIRAGDVDTGLAELEGVRAPEPFKAMVRGEVAAFRLDWDTTVDESLTVVEAAWTERAWDSGTVFQDHLRLLTYAALRSGSHDDVLEFVGRLPLRGDHTDRVLSMAVVGVRNALENDTTLDERARHEIPRPRGTGAGISSLYNMLATNRPRVPPDSADGISYLLNLAHTSIATSEVLTLYETVADQLVLPQQHEETALLYLAVADEAGAWRAMCRYARVWAPFEHSQVEPVQLFGSYALGQLITEERGRTILYRQFDEPAPLGDGDEVHLRPNAVDGDHLGREVSDGARGD